MNWLRTGRMAAVPREVKFNVTGLLKEDLLDLRGDGATLLHSTWRRENGTAQTKPKMGLKYEIAYMLGLEQPSDVETKKWSKSYKDWKAGLPKAAQALIYDFIELELIGPAKFTAFYGNDNGFSLSPFGDRRLIELTLQLPLTQRFGGKAVEEVIATAAPDLAGLPYAADLARDPSQGQAISESAA